jgi:hypothetical protein
LAINCQDRLGMKSHAMPTRRTDPVLPVLRAACLVR